MRLNRKNRYVNAPQCYVISTLLIFLFLTVVLRPVDLATLRCFEDWVWTANLLRLSGRVWLRHRVKETAGTR